MNNKTVAVILVLLLCAGIVYGASAQREGPIELQPYWKFMNGEEEFGLGWAFDGGTLIMTEGGLLFTCGCEECYVETEVAPTPTGRPGQTATVVPTDPVSTPTPEDTPPPPPSTTKCNRGLGNDSEGCDPGNSAGQGQGEGRDAGEDKDEHKKDK